tara:strand:- start:101705 stop:102526 length:822 start_codon:yes stop_codon:yes gene_type:complete
MLDSFNEWHLKTCFSGCLKDIYYTDGDTLVQGKTYKILDGFHFISRTFLIREDVAQKKVYMLFNLGPDSQEKLMYDFSVQQGDTILMENLYSPFPQEPGYFICDSIVAKPLVDSQLYEHFYFHPLDTIKSGTQMAVWVESVGSLSLINAPAGEPDTNGRGAVNCFFKAGQIHYELDPASTPCVATRFPLSVSGPKQKEPQIILDYTSKSIQIMDVTENSYLHAYNLQGQLLFSTHLIKNQLNWVKYNPLNSQIVLLRITGQSGKTTVKKVFLR